MRDNIQFDNLLKKEKYGTLSVEDEKELDRKMGVCFQVTLFGETYKVNHCIIARTIIGGFMLMMIVSLIYMCSNEIY